MICKSHQPTRRKSSSLVKIASLWSENSCPTSNESITFCAYNLYDLLFKLIFFQWGYGKVGSFGRSIRLLFEFEGVTLGLFGVYEQRYCNAHTMIVFPRLVFEFQLLYMSEYSRKFLLLTSYFYVVSFGQEYSITQIKLKNNKLWKYLTSDFFSAAAAAALLLIDAPLK